MKNKDNLGASDDRALSPSATEPKVSAHSGVGPSRGDLFMYVKEWPTYWLGCIVEYVGDGTGVMIDLLTASSHGALCEKWDDYLAKLNPKES